MNQLQKIDYLISEYKMSNYKTETFCDEFVRVLYYEKDGSIENKLWDVLDTYAKVFSRFSPFEEDAEHFFITELALIECSPRISRYFDLNSDILEITER